MTVTLVALPREKETEKSMPGYKGQWPKAQKMNWDSVEKGGLGGGGAPLPRWIYSGEITVAERRLTKDGDPKVYVEVNLSGSHEDLVDVGRRKQFLHLTFKGGAFRTKQLCEALGAEPPASTSEEDLDEFAAAILGETIYFVLRQRKDQNGEPSNEIDYILAESEIDEIAEKLEPPGEAGGSRSKSKSNGARANGAKARRSRDEEVEEVDTEDESDDEVEEDEEDEEEVVEAAPRRRGRPPKDRSARR